MHACQRLFTLGKVVLGGQKARLGYGPIQIFFPYWIKMEPFRPKFKNRFKWIVNRMCGGLPQH